VYFSKLLVGCIFGRPFGPIVDDFGPSRRHGWLEHLLVGRLGESDACLSGWLVGCLACWLVVWLVGWLIEG